MALTGQIKELGCRHSPKRLEVPSLKVLPQTWLNKKPSSPGKRAIYGLNLAQIFAPITTEEKLFKESFVSRDNKNLGRSKRRQKDTPLEEGGERSQLVDKKQGGLLGRDPGFELLLCDRLIGTA